MGEPVYSPAVDAALQWLLDLPLDQISHLDTLTNYFGEKTLTGVVQGLTIAKRFQVPPA